MGQRQDLVGDTLGGVATIINGAVPGLEARGVGPIEGWKDEVCAASNQSAGCSPRDLAEQEATEPKIAGAPGLGDEVLHRAKA
jgi:hypothetical protein